MVFIGIGVLGSIGILASFDWSAWSDVKDLPYTFPEEYAVMKQEFTTLLTLAFSTLLGSLAIGSILIALDRIIAHLSVMNESMRRMRYAIEEQNKDVN